MRLLLILPFLILWSNLVQAIAIGPVLSSVRMLNIEPTTGYGIRLDAEVIPIGGDFLYWATRYEVPGGKMALANRQFKAWAHFPIIPFFYLGGAASMNRLTTEGVDSNDKIAETTYSLVGVHGVVGTEFSFGAKIFAEIDFGYIPGWSTLLLQIGVLF